jgi:hypothetical protein
MPNNLSWDAASSGHPRDNLLVLRSGMATSQRPPENLSGAQVCDPAHVTPDLIRGVGPSDSSSVALTTPPSVLLQQYGSLEF